MSLVGILLWLLIAVSIAVAAVQASPLVGAAVIVLFVLIFELARRRVYYG